MDRHQKEFLAKKAQKMNPEWLKTGKFSEHLEKINAVNKKILSVINKLPLTLKYILSAGILANVGIWIKLIYDWFMIIINAIRL